MVSEYNHEEERRKEWVKRVVEDASSSKYCSNCFMALGLKSMAGATIKTDTKEFCNRECYDEYMENLDDEYTISI